MKLFQVDQDGGPASTVWGLFFLEWKAVFSVVLLCFEEGTREAYHSHAFNAVSWVLRGRLDEHFYGGGWKVHTPSFVPVLTSRSTNHKVVSRGRTWVLSFRGPWSSTWTEYLPNEGRHVTLSHGRREV